MNQFFPDGIPFQFAVKQTGTAGSHPVLFPALLDSNQNPITLLAGQRVVVDSVSISGFGAAGSSTTATTTFTSTGTNTWTCPATIDLATWSCDLWAGGNGGQPNGGNGGAGAFWGELYAVAGAGTVAITPGSSYTVTVGAGGASGNNGAASSFGPDDNGTTWTITAGSGTTCGSYSPAGWLPLNSVAHSGLHNGGGTGDGTAGAGGGGAAAGDGAINSAGAGGNGTNASGVTPGTGGTGGRGAYNVPDISGGNGGNGGASASAGSPGVAPGGGGGGGGLGASGGAGAGGQATLVYVYTQAATPAAVTLFIDANGNGAYDPGEEIVGALVDGSATFEMDHCCFTGVASDGANVGKLGIVPMINETAYIVVSGHIFNG